MRNPNQTLQRQLWRGEKMTGITAEKQYKEKLRRQRRELEEFAAHETKRADDLTRWFKQKEMEIPEDASRVCDFFKNREYLVKPGSLTLLYFAYADCVGELPSSPRENAFDLLCFRFKRYAKALKTGGYDG